MKKISFGLCIIMILISCAGCSEKKKMDDEKVVLQWSMFDNTRNHEVYLNEILEEKGYPYEIKIVSEDNGETADLLEVGSYEWAKAYDTDQEAKEGKLLALDSFLESEEGKKLKECFPDTIWNAYKIDGSTYTIPSIGYVPFKTAYIWDTSLAEKYDIHPETWDEKLWEHMDELKKVSEGEGNKVLAYEANLYNMGKLNGYTEALGLYYPFVYDEINGGNLKFLYETEHFKESLEGYKKLYEAGICKDDFETSDVFLYVDSVFVSEAAKETMEPGFWKTHAYKVFSQEYLWELSVTAREVGVSVKSSKQNEALKFMALLYTDPDLSNALAWGKLGKDYELDNDVACPVGDPGSYLDNVAAGNRLITYVEQGQDPGKTELYYKWLEEIPVSKLSGFRFSGKKVSNELEQCHELSRNIQNLGVLEFYDSYSAIIDDYKKAGMDKIIEEWNRQFTEFKNGDSYGT